MRYNVSRQYPRGVDTVFASFVDIIEAQFFINAKIEADAVLKIFTIYRIQEFGDIIQEFDPSKMNIDIGSQGQGQESASRFSPTPFNSAPQPKGTPPKWNKDEDE